MSRVRILSALAGGFIAAAIAAAAYAIESEKLLAALISLLGVLAAAVVGLLLQFLNAAELRKRPFLEKQLELCLEATNVAATLTTTTSKKTFDQAHARFLELFWGPLSVVESDGVSAAMVELRKELNALLAKGAGLPFKGLQTRSYKLAREVSNLILDAWDITALKTVLEAQDPKLQLHPLQPVRAQPSQTPA